MNLNSNIIIILLSIEITGYLRLPGIGNIIALKPAFLVSDNKIPYGLPIKRGCLPRQAASFKPIL